MMCGLVDSSESIYICQAVAAEMNRVRSKVEQRNVNFNQRVYPSSCTPTCERQ